MNRQVIVRYDRIENCSDLAARVCFTDRKFDWLPYSQIAFPANNEVQIPEWMARDKGLPIEKVVEETPEGEEIATEFKHLISGGRYTVVFPNDEWRTLRIKPSFRDAQNELMAQYLCGPDNDSMYKGFAFVKGDQISIWRSFDNEDSKIVEALETLVKADDKSEYGLNYAMRSGNCYHCNRTLTVPASLHRGLGPICAKRM